MNIGKKIITLKEGNGFKNYQEFGKFVGLNGDWINELSKKEEISTIDVTRLVVIAEKFDVSVDWLLSDDEDNNVIGKYPNNDIATMLSTIQEKLKDKSVFEGTELQQNTAKLANDAIDTVKKLIRSNL